MPDFAKYSVEEEEDEEVECVLWFRSIVDECDSFIGNNNGISKTRTFKI